MVDSRKEQPVTLAHFKDNGYTVPEELLALVTGGELKDLSWHNDAAPLYGVVVDDEVTVGLWADHVDPKAREHSEGERFCVSVFNYDGKRLNIPNADNVVNTDDIGVAIKAWRETLAEVKRQLDAHKPKTCEACNVALTEDLQCPKCGVSHSGDACPTCGRFGLHKDDCDQEPLGNGFEGGPAHRTKEERIAEGRALVAAFEKEYPKYNSWTFAFEYPGYFSYYDSTGELTVLFTPDFNKFGEVDVQVAAPDGDAVGYDGGVNTFKADRSAAALFAIVKPHLDKLAGKKVSDLKK